MLSHMVELFRQWRFWKAKRRRWRGRSLSSPAISHAHHPSSPSPSPPRLPDLSAVSTADLRCIDQELKAMEKTTARLLLKLNEAPDDPPTSAEDECVICVSSRACLQTFPCGHRVLCRRCFVKTIQAKEKCKVGLQMAVSERQLPLRCVVCRSKIARLKHQSSGRRVRILMQGGPPPPLPPLGLSSNAFHLSST